MRPVIRTGDNWITIQERLQHLHEGRIDALRQLIYDCGGNIRAELVTFIASVAQQESHVFPPYCCCAKRWIASLFAYASFCLEGDRKARGSNAFISGWHLSDHCEIWLEALRLVPDKAAAQCYFHSTSVLALSCSPGKMVPGDHRRSSLPGKKNSLPSGATWSASLEFITL